MTEEHIYGLIFLVIFIVALGLIIMILCKNQIIVQNKELALAEPSYQECYDQYILKSPEWLAKSECLKEFQHRKAVEALN